MAQNMAAAAAMKGKTPTPPENLMTHAQPGIENEKRALLALIAEKGTEGYAEWERQKAQAGAARAATLEKAAARGGAAQAPAALMAELAQDYDGMIGGYTDAAVQAQMSHGREMDRIGAANAAYMDQMGSAVPALTAELDSEIEKMRLAYEFALEQLKLEAAGKGGGGRGGGGGGGGSGFELPMPADDRNFLAGSTDADGSYQRNEDRRNQALRPGPVIAGGAFTVTNRDTNADSRMRARAGKPTRRGVTNNDRSADQRMAARARAARKRTPAGARLSQLAKGSR